MPDTYLKQLSESGMNLIKAIGGLTQIARMHVDNNVLLVAAADKFTRLISLLSEKEDGITLVHSDGRFYCQGNKIVIDQADRRLCNRIICYLEKRNIYSLNFRSDFKGVSNSSVITFARLVDQAGRHPAPSEWLSLQLDEHQIQWAEINQKKMDSCGDSSFNATDAGLQHESAVKKAQARQYYFQVLGSIKEVSRKLSSNHNTVMRNTVRLVQKMVDIITEDESFFSILGTVRFYDDYTYVHSLNVAILAMCLGKQIGLDHMMLERLGLCGLFHDLGKVEIPKPILNKRGRLNDDEYAIIKTHPIHSARLILKLKAGHDRKIKLLMAPFEHHMGYNRSGYPQVGNNRGISLFGRILSIADVYDAITSPRIYRGKTLSPDRALGFMLEQANTSFDPVLLKVFINMLGAYPVGTLVKLNTSQMGIVMGQSKGKDKTKPIIRLLKIDANNRFIKGPILDLSEQCAPGKACRRAIVESMHPADAGIQAVEFLL